MLTRPDQLALVTAGKASCDDVVEETLRALSPVEYIPLRFAVEDIELDGVTIAAGEPILIAFARPAAIPNCTVAPRRTSTSPAPTRST